MGLFKADDGTWKDTKKRDKFRIYLEREGKSTRSIKPKYSTIGNIVWDIRKLFKK